jgi:hypothetical protein
MISQEHEHLQNEVTPQLPENFTPHLLGALAGLEGVWLLSGERTNVK